MTPPTDSEPTMHQLHLSNPGTVHAQWVLGFVDDSVGFFAEDSYPLPGASADAEPTIEVVDWVAERLNVTGVALVLADDERAWSVAITG
jgi:hypothetical protein